MRNNEYLAEFFEPIKLMTRFFPLSLTAIAAFLLLSCAPKEQSKDVPQMTFRASQEYGLDTKTSLSGTKVLWSASDKISIFSATCTSGETYSINSEDAGKGEAGFTGNAVGSAPWYALYPADGMASFADGAISLSLPAVQQYAADGFADGANPMVAVSSTDKLSFKNLCGILSIQLTGSATISSIEVISAAQEALWGPGTVDISWTDAPALVLSAAADDDHRTLTLDCGEGVALSSTPTTFNLVLPVGTLGSGFTVKVHDITGGVMVKETANTSLIVTRATIKRLNAVSYVPTESAFLSLEIPGIYDLSGGVPVPLKAYKSGDQLAIRVTTDGKRYFRIQNLEDACALIIEYPSSVQVNSVYTLKVSSIGETSIPDATVQATLLLNEDDALYFQDFENNRGYMIFDVD